MSQRTSSSRHRTRRHKPGWRANEWPDAAVGALGTGAAAARPICCIIWTERFGADSSVRAWRCTTWTALPQAGCVAIDDADRITGEELLLHLLNMARDRGLRVLLGGPFPAGTLARLPARPVEPAAGDQRRGDWSSRTTIFCICCWSGRCRSVSSMSPVSVQDWLLHHLPRTASGVLEAVRRLDARKPVATQANHAGFRRTRSRPPKRLDEVSMSCAWTGPSALAGRIGWAVNSRRLRRIGMHGDQAACGAADSLGGDTELS